MVIASFLVQTNDSRMDAVLQLLQSFREIEIIGTYEDCRIGCLAEVETNDHLVRLTSDISSLNGVIGNYFVYHHYE